MFISNISYKHNPAYQYSAWHLVLNTYEVHLLEHEVRHCISTLTAARKMNQLRKWATAYESEQKRSNFYLKHEILNLGEI